MIPSPAWLDRYHFGLEAAKRAGANALKYFGSDVAVEWKADESPVTVADKSSEELLKKELAARFPGDGFLGEEYGHEPGTTGFRWIVDPIDGTRNFVRGVPIWATLVGLEFNGDAIAGFAIIPAMNRSYSAMRGHGAYRDGNRIHVSKTDTLKQATAIYTEIAIFQKEGKGQQFLDFSAACDRTRGFGDFYGFLLVADGSADVAVDSGLKIWDAAALVAIVEEAGGKFTNWIGDRDWNGPRVLGTNGILHEPARKFFA